MVSDSVKRILDAEAEGEKKQRQAGEMAEQIIAKARLQADGCLTKADADAAAILKTEQEEWDKKATQRADEIGKETDRLIAELEKTACERYEKAVEAAINAITE